MKHTRNLISCFSACAIAVAMVSTLSAQTAADGGAKVVRVKGPARYTTGNGVWQPLKAGAVLRPGTVVQTSTEKGSYIDLVLGDGSAALPTPVVYKPYIPSSMAPSVAYRPSSEQNIVRVWENTALGIDKLTSMSTGADVVTETQLDLKTGRITGNVKKMSAASKYEVKLPNGVAGIRGTSYDMTAEGVVRVMVGSVVVAWVDPKTGNVVTQVVMGSQQYDARTGQVTPIDPGDVKVIDKSIGAMRVTALEERTTMASDRDVEQTITGDQTFRTVSPHGPPFEPPGPPPVIPPRGHGP